MESAWVRGLTVFAVGVLICSSENYEQDVKFNTGELSKEDILNIILKADLFTLNDPA